MLIEYMSMFRRIYTDGRKWPENAEPSYMGYSIGKWVDNGGRRPLRYAGSGDSQLERSRVYSTPAECPCTRTIRRSSRSVSTSTSADPNILHDEITTIDNALTRPWTVTKKYHRERKQIWVEEICAEGNQHVYIGTENYMLSADGYLMPPRKARRRRTCDISIRRRSEMLYRKAIGAAAMTAALCLATGRASAFDDAKYPDLKGQWICVAPPGQRAFDPGKPRGWAQQAPLTPEYKAVFEANLADLAAGGEGLWPGYD